MDIKTPFSDRVEQSPLGKKGSKGGDYDAVTVPDTPKRDTSPNGVAELTFDTAATSKAPSTSAMSIKSPFKDTVS